MPITTKEIVIDERVLGSVLALAPKDQAKLVQLLSEQLPPGEQVRLIMLLLPNVAPTIKAALRRKTLPIVGGRSAEDAHSLLESWLNEPAADEDDQSWDEIMHNLGAYSESNPYS